MYRIFFGIIAGIVLLLTLCAWVFKPQMHKPFMLYNSDYKIVQNEPEIKTDKNLPAQVNKPQNIQKVEKIETYTVRVPQKFEQQKQKTTSVNIQHPLANLFQKEKTTTTSQNTNVEQTTQPSVKVMTDEERARQEVILWNEWRSNLQNRIMQDVRLPIVPEGTIFKFSFNVDKYGKISNVQTWSLSPAYTPYAIQYIAPVIRSYQGHDILNFPAGSNRFSTVMEGGWKISQTAKYSMPEDFSDTEKILNRY